MCVYITRSTMLCGVSVLEWVKLSRALFLFIYLLFKSQCYHYKPGSNLK